MTYNDLVTNKLYSLNGGSTGGGSTGAQRDNFANIVFWGTPSLFISLVLILKVTMLKKITEYIA